MYVCRFICSSLIVECEFDSLYAKHFYLCAKSYLCAKPSDTKVINRRTYSPTTNYQNRPLRIYNSAGCSADARSRKVYALYYTGL